MSKNTENLIYSVSAVDVAAAVVDVDVVAVVIDVDDSVDDVGDDVGDDVDVRKHAGNVFKRRPNII